MDEHGSQLTKTPPSTVPASRAEVKALLIRGRELISNGWTREVYARDGSGREVEPTSPRARRYCAVGSLIRADHEINNEPWERATIPIAYEGSGVFITAHALLSTAAQLAVIHPHEQSNDDSDRIWAHAALRAST